MELKIVRRVAGIFHRRAIELVLILVVLLLVAQLCWPSIMNWWNLPRAGRIGLEHFTSTSLADKFVIWLPDSYRNADSLWPLVVFLHGRGESGNDPSILWNNAHPIWRGLPAIVVAPQCRESYNWSPDAIVSLIRYLEARYHVDRDRVYLVGYSMGGCAAWHTAATYPNLFAAIVPISGGGIACDAKSLATVQVWAFHGALDNVVPVEDNERMIAAFHNAGGQGKLTIISDAGHGICDSVCGRADLWRWLFAQKRCDSINAQRTSAP